MSHLPRSDESPGARPAAAPAPARRSCPRCGSALGALGAAPSAGAARGGGPPAPAALYCGCCGLVVPAR